MHQEKFHISINTSPRAAQSWNKTILTFWAFLPVILHFATKLFTAVPKFWRHWMRVPAAYKQTKNQINATTHITAGSCYREVCWKWHVATNGQKATISHLYARSKLKNWPSPPSSCCFAGHREVHQEKFHISINTSPRAAQSWNKTILTFWAFLPVILHFATKLFSAVPKFRRHWMRVPAAYKQTKNQINGTTPITAGSCYTEVCWKWHVGTNGQKATISNLSARSKLKNWPSPPSSCCLAGHREVHQEKFHISINTSPRAAQSWNKTILTFWAFLPVILHFATKLFTAVPKFQRHWMRVPAAYKQTKNQINATTHITAGSCYREVCWKWHVATNGQKATISHLYARSKLKNWPSPPSSCCLAGHREVHQEKFHISINTSPRAAQSWNKTISTFWAFLLVILHFATKLFTAVPKFRRHWMRVPVAYKQTKNQINATTHITAWSCYREVCWKWHVATNGQKATISHLSARSKLKNWPSPPSSCCLAGHREVHQEKFHISINTSPRAAQSWNKTILTFWAFLPVILHFATKLFSAVPKFRRHWMRVPAAYKQTKNQINATTPITAGSCYTEVCWKWHVGTNGQKATISNLSARSKLKNWPSPPSSCCLAGHREVHQEKFHISINTSPRAAQSWNKTIFTFWAFLPVILHFATKLFTAVPKFCRHWMRVPAAYKQTKNQINATTHITAGSCYREVCWKWHVGTNGQKATISHLSARSKLKNWPSPPSSCFLGGHREVHQEKFHISINTSPRAAQSWNKTILTFWAFLPVILHFATKLFTAVPKFWRHWMRVPAAYKQTKNQINATTHITAGSCYREVCWKWHVATNGQKATISHLYARSKLKNWPSPPSSCCLAGHREVHQEKFHISINTSPRAAQSWNKTILTFWAFLPVILHFATKLFSAVPKFRRHWMRVPAAYKQTKNQINATTPITAGSCYTEVCWKWHVGTNGQKATISNLSARSKLKNWPSPPSSCCLAGHREVHQEKFHISINTSPRAAQSWNKTILTCWAFLPVILHFATKLFTAVPKFQRHWMRVPAAYKQTKNQINATTHITAGSCYREVCWKWHVATNGQKATISNLSARSKLKNWPSPPSSCCLAGHREVHQEKFHISINTSPRAAQSWNITILTFWAFLPVILHFATKVFTAVPKFCRHWMRVPAAYKQTKNQINATTHITAGSCYREVCWKWHVATNGQKATISHLSARSKLKNWPSPPSSCFLGGHREVHQEKFHISINTPPRAAQSWNKTILTFWAFLPVILHFATKLFTAVPKFRRHWMRVPAAYKQTKNQINATTPITAGSCYTEVCWKWHVGTNGQKATISNLSARSKLKNWPSPPSSCCLAGHREVHQVKFHISINTSPRAAQSWNKTISTFWAFLPVILPFATKLFIAVPKFQRHWMRVPAAYKQTKNKINATTHITAVSCYTEVCWKWHVATNGQKATISPLSARSKLKNWPSPPWSCCLAGHREVHQEKFHISINTSPRAAQSWN